MQDETKRDMSSKIGLRGTECFEETGDGWVALIISVQAVPLRLVIWQIVMADLATKQILGQRATRQRACNVFSIQNVFRIIKGRTEYLQKNFENSLSSHSNVYTKNSEIHVVSQTDITCSD